MSMNFNVLFLFCVIVVHHSTKKNNNNWKSSKDHDLFILITFCFNQSVDVLFL
jgi:hypothetical protein